MAFLHEDDDHNDTDEKKEYGGGQILVGTSKGTSYW